MAVDQMDSQTNTGGVSTAIVIELASRTDTDVDDIPPLYDVVDPEALDRLVDRATSDCTISFEYFDHQITVWGDNTVDIQSLDI